MQEMPAILPVLPVQIGEMIFVAVFSEDAIGGVILDFSAVLYRAEFLRLRAAAGCY